MLDFVYLRFVVNTLYAIDVVIFQISVFDLFKVWTPTRRKLKISIISIYQLKKSMNKLLSWDCDFNRFVFIIPSSD